MADGHNHQPYFFWAVLRRTAHSHLLLLAAVDVCLIIKNYFCRKYI